MNHAHTFFCYTSKGIFYPKKDPKWSVLIRNLTMTKFHPNFISGHGLYLTQMAPMQCETIL